MKGRATRSERVWGRLLLTMQIAWGLLSFPLVLTHFKRKARGHPPTPFDPGDDPTTREYAALWQRIDRLKVVGTMLWLDPKAAGLNAGNPVNSSDATRRVLGEASADISRLVELSATPCGPWPPLDNFDPWSGVHMKHPRAWFQNLARVLSADAARCWDEGDAAGAALRLRAVIRWGAQLCGQPDDLTRLIGRGQVLAAARARLRGQLDRGLAARLTTDLRRSLAEELEGAGSARAFWFNEWRRMAGEQIAAARRALEDPEPGAALHAAVAWAGRSTEDEPVRDTSAWCGQCMWPLTWHLKRVRDLTPTQICGTLREAERLITTLAEAPPALFEPALRACIERAAEDPTHLLRVLVARPGQSYSIAAREEAEDAELLAQLRV